MSNHENEAMSQLAQLFDRWKAEHCELAAYMLEVFDWMNQAAHAVEPPREQALDRLRQLQLRLEQHFAHEEVLGRLLAESHGASTEEIDAVCRRADREHQTLGSRLEAIIDELERGSRAIERWHARVVEFNLFFDLLEQHEEQEESSIVWLRPRPTQRPADSSSGR